jgi:hypothetical protein
MAEIRVFKRLAIDVFFNPIVTGSVLVEWALEKDFVAGAEGPFTFILERGYAANDDNFVPVAQTTDQPWAYDNDPQLPDKGTDVFYRVKLIDGAGQEYLSQATAVGTYWNRYDYTLAREIIRKEHLLQRKRAGVRGWLLKRRVYGESCPVCVDPDTGQINNPQCPVCFGTGITGGYYDAFEYWVIMNPSQRLGKVDAEQGLITATMETVRAMAYPRPDMNDVWVHAHTDQRFLVQGDVTALARHRGIDLILNLRLDERDRTEVIYKVPVPCQ